MYLRLSNYYQAAYLKRGFSSSLICRSIYKNGLESFELLILELNPINLSEAEQRWIDFLGPEYNTQKMFFFLLKIDTSPNLIALVLITPSLVKPILLKIEKWCVP
uniref:GIY-YIG endonuclease n=1 Tax=Microbotryum lychnidis-dioicae TaxID=288795 RepID=M1GLD1_9BASI|nr:hypothetical protein H911_mgp05 [Microbotryum lychnidis-dioicae]AGE14613.1 hypothetical protein [Microbotryum lychnidis-dioicae]